VENFWIYERTKLLLLYADTVKYFALKGILFTVWLDLGKFSLRYNELG